MLHENEIPPSDKTSLDVLASIPWTGRAVLLVDLDAFFASVEQLDHPEWRGKPVIVGGSPERRGVVSTASYEARTYGVHSAMPSWQAARLCPQAIWTHGHYARYREVSDQVMSIVQDETPLVEQVSIDEAFFDVTPGRYSRESPIDICRRIQQRVSELGVTCSIGLGTNKTVAKIASERQKPRGLTVVLPGTEAAFLAPLPVRAMSGIGSASESHLADLGIRTLGQLAKQDPERMRQIFGVAGPRMVLRASGREESQVRAIDAPEEVKSVSNEVSFAEDLVKREDITGAISSMAAKVGRRLRRKGLKGSTLALKVRYSDRSVRSVQRPIGQPSDDEYLFMEMLEDMLPDLWNTGMALRLVGVAVTGFDTAKDEPEQLSLFDDTTEVKADVAAESETARRRGLMSATDKVKERFGESAVRFGRELRLSGNTTGSSSKNPADYK